MADIQEITKKLIDFRNKREWQHYHNPKDIALSITLEAAELLEHFQWKSEEDIMNHIKKNKKEIGEEMADVFNWILIMSHDLGIDILDAAEKKIEQNAKKYPVSKSRGTYKKYTELK